MCQANAKKNKLKNLEKKKKETTLKNLEKNYMYFQ